jgi:hypothetical protein
MNMKIAGLLVATYFKPIYPMSFSVNAALRNAMLAWPI